MGGIGRALFGGGKQSSQSTQESESKSSSWNQAFDFLKDAYGGQIGAGTGATDALSALLGIGGDPAAQKAAFDNYKNSAGYNFMLDSGSKAITGNAAAKGLLNSGATLKRLSRFGTDVASTYYNNYLDKLLGLSGQGLQAGGIIANAGQRSEGSSFSRGQSTSSGSQKPGLGGAIGSIASGIAASDPRLKHTVTHIGNLPETGLNLYTFRYTFGDDTLHVGVMADEVERTHPEFLGPKTEDGYSTVDYDKLRAFEGV